MFIFINTSSWVPIIYEFELKDFGKHNFQNGDAACREADSKVTRCAKLILVAECPNLIGQESDHAIVEWAHVVNSRQ